MDHTERMGCSDAFEDLVKQTKDPVNRHQHVLGDVPSEGFLERFTVDELHHEVERAGLDDDGVASDNVLVVDAGEHATFFKDSTSKLFAMGVLGSNGLHHDREVGVDVGSEVDDAHASFAEDGVDAVLSIHQKSKREWAGCWDGGARWVNSGVDSVDGFAGHGAGK